MARCCRVKKLPVLRVLHYLALAIPAGQIIERCANTINGDTWGSVTPLPWGFVYRNPHALLPADLLSAPTHRRRSTSSSSWWSWPPSSGMRSRA